VLALAARLEQLPPLVPVYRTLLGAPTRVAPRSLTSVLATWPAWQAG